MLFSRKPVLLECTRKAMVSLLLYKAIFTTSSYNPVPFKSKRGVVLNNVRHLQQGHHKERIQPFLPPSSHWLKGHLMNSTCFIVIIWVCACQDGKDVWQRLLLVKSSLSLERTHTLLTSTRCRSFEHTCSQSTSFRIALKIPNNKSGSHENTEQ